MRYRRIQFFGTYLFSLRNFEAHRRKFLIFFSRCALTESSITTEMCQNSPIISMTAVLIRRESAMCMFNIGRTLCNVGLRRSRHLTQYAERDCFNFHFFCAQA